MNTRTRIQPRCAIGVLTLTLFWNSCATETHTERQGTGIGAAIGATAGAIVGRQIFGDRGGTIAGALVGGLIGAAAGKTWADRVEQSRRQYQTEEQRLAATIYESSKIQAELEKENRRLAEHVEKSRTEVARLLADYENRTAAKADLANAKKRIDAQRQAAANERADLERTIAAEEAALTAARRAALVAADELEHRINGHRQELANLSRLEGELLQLSSSLST